MRTDEKQPDATLLERTSLAVAKGLGTTRGFMIGVAVVIAMFIFGTKSDFDHHWHLNLHTVISIITFILLFITARVEQKEISALHLKLNELLAALEGASNNMINAERASEKELKEARKAYSDIADGAGAQESTSIEKQPPQADNASDDQRD